MVKGDERRTRGLSAFTKETAFISYHITSPRAINIQLQNLDQTSASKSWSNSFSKAGPKFSLKIDKTSDLKSWPKFSYKILIKSQPQSLDKRVTSKSWPNFSFDILTKTQLWNLDQTVVNMFLSINIPNINNIKKFWVGIFKSQSHITQVSTTGVSEWWVTRVDNDLTWIR